MKEKPYTNLISNWITDSPHQQPQHKKQRQKQQQQQQRQQQQQQQQQLQNIKATTNNTNYESRVDLIVKVSR